MAEKKASGELLNRAPENDASNMTIEFLRARLLSERAASKAAREQANRIAEQVKELQARLDMEIESRKKEETSIEHLLMVLKAKGLIKDMDTLSVKSGETNEEDNTDRGVYVQIKINEILSRFDKKDIGDKISNKDEPKTEDIGDTASDKYIGETMNNKDVVKESTVEPKSKGIGDTMNNKVIAKDNINEKKILESSRNQTADKYCTAVKLSQDAKESHREAALPQNQLHSTIKEETSVNQTVKHTQENLGTINETKETVGVLSDASRSVLEKQECTDFRPSLALKLKNIIHQIEGDLDTISNEQSLKDRVQDWVDHVVTMLDKDKEPLVNEYVDADKPKSVSNIERNPSSKNEVHYFESKSSPSVGPPLNHVIDGSAQQALPSTDKTQVVNEQSRGERDLNKNLLHSVEVKFRNERPTDSHAQFIPPNSNDPPLMHRRQASYDSITQSCPPTQDEFGMPSYSTMNNRIPGYHPPFANRHVSSMTDTTYNGYDYRNVAEQPRMPHQNYDDYYGNRSIFSGRTLSMDRRGNLGSGQGSYTNARYNNEDRELTSRSNLSAPQIKKEAYILADEINGRLADTLKVLHIAECHVKDTQGSYIEDQRSASHGSVHQDYYVDVMHVAGYGYNHHQELYVSKQPLVSPYPSSYVNYNSIAFERHARHRRSNSLYSNFMTPGVEAHFQQREVHLCNGITLYTE